MTTTDLARRAATDPAPAPATRRPRFTSAGVTKHVYMITMIVLMLFPLYLTIIGSFKELNQILDDFFLPTLPLHTENYVRAFDYISPYYVNTIIYAALSIVLTVGAATLAGYAFSALRFPFRRILFLLLFAKMFLPGVMSLVPSFVLASNLGLLNTPFVIALFCMGTSMPFWVFVMKVFVDQQPRELFESMRMDGASELRIFVSLVLPLLRPMVALMSLNVLLFIWNDFIWPLVTLTDEDKRTITVGIFKLSSAAGLDYGMMIAGYALAALPLLIAFFIAMRAFMSGLTAGAIKL
ncbi:carbohydrate ABC transporter permease [Jiangella mangrovi]|uniref:Multiple sugar transport system permease protein n=1 Tax=Jiangella mangrovi TaxID=1524084 RepID=A0A7W9GX64_9ACTN|nr:carbohydrate ABC transporter permease [Jiangella mangrovi]MBB5791705.1 multiple sugar transport system permease protein [Jiangella mangrovi]